MKILLARISASLTLAVVARLPRDFLNLNLCIRSFYTSSFAQRLRDSLSAALFAPLFFVSSLSHATILFSDDFKTKYPWPAVPNTYSDLFNNSVFHSTANYGYVDTGDGTQMIIDRWPPDNTKYALRHQYVRREDSDVIAHSFNNNHTIDITRPKEIYVQWKEYRSSQFDFGPSKDWRINAFQAGDFGDLHTNNYLDIYGGVGTGTVPGYGDSTAIGINIQAYGYDQGNGGFVVDQPYVMPRATAVAIQLHIKMNTPGNFDGAAEIWINGVKQPNSRTNVKYSPDSGSPPGQPDWGGKQAYIDGFQLGMSATNGSSDFVNPDGSTPVTQNYIWRTDLVISDTYIQNGLGPHSGDVNDDGQLSLADLLLVQKYLLGQATLAPDQLQKVDVFPTGGNGVVTFADLLVLQQKVLHLVLY
jgi:hypothetical protein